MFEKFKTKKEEKNPLEKETVELETKEDVLVEPIEEKKEDDKKEEIEVKNEVEIPEIKEEIPPVEKVVIDYEKIGDLLKNPLRILNSNILKTKEELTELTKQINTLEDVNRQQQQVIQRHQSDIMEKVKHPMFMSLIQLGDGVRNILAATDNTESQSNNSELTAEIKKIEIWIDDILLENGVVRFQTLSPEEFNPKNQEIAIHRDTDNPDLAEKVTSLSPGYRWTLPYLIINSDVKLAKVAVENKVPQKFTFVIRPEEVVYYNKNI